MEEIKIDKNEEGTYLTENEVTAVRALLQSYPIHNHDGRNSVQVASTKVKNSINSQKIILPTDMVCGEDIDNGDAVMIGSGLNVTHQNARDTYYNAYVGFGTGSSLEYKILYQSFQVSEAISMKGYVIYINAKSGRVCPKLYSDNNGKPGTLLASGSASYTPNTWEVVWCPCEYNLQANTTYWIDIVHGEVLYRSYSKIDTLKKYANGKATLYYNDNGQISWTDQNYDCFFGIYFTGEDKLYKAASLDTSYTANFVGIANRSNKKGETPEVIVVGVKDNFTGLTTGSKYYLTDDVGKISTTAGYISKQVGYSASESILVINLQ